MRRPHSYAGECAAPGSPAQLIRRSHVRTIERLGLVAVALVMLPAMAPVRAFALPDAKPCTRPEYRQFDFWVGDWNVTEKDAATSTAHVRVDRILGGCVLREHYEDDTGAVGESFSTYDVGRRVWHQTWVTNRGRLLTIEGGEQEGGMRLAGSYYLENGDEVRVRGIWSPMGSNVRETAVTSSDAGKTWKPWFDLVFRPRKEATGSDGQEDDATAVARLDDAYQAAVKQNDAEQIDHILSDDFVLVTGSGKIVNKQAILEEARSRTTIYEHQEDSERTVRLLGDTALVTARLRVKGVRNGAPIDYSVWFTDVYRRTANGWRYVFGQASLPLPKQP